MKQAYQAANPIDAQLVVDLLASEGIGAFVQGQYLSGGIGELPAGELMRVWVGDEDFKRARDLVDGRGEAQELIEDAIDPVLAKPWWKLW